MTSDNTFRPAVRRMGMIVAVYAILFVLQEIAHGKVDQVWSANIQASNLAICLIGPVFGIGCLLLRYRRAGGILLLGSMPGGLWILISARFVQPHEVILPLTDPGMWRVLYEVTYVLLLVCAIGGTVAAYRLVRSFQQPPLEPVNPSGPE